MNFLNVPALAKAPYSLHTRDLVVSCTVPGFNLVVMSSTATDQISFTSSMQIPQITTPPKAHHDRPASESDSIHLDPKPESRYHPLVAYWQQTLPSHNQKTGKLLSSCLTCKFVIHLIIGWHISKHLTRTFLFIFYRLNEMRRVLKLYCWAEPTKIPTFFPPEDPPGPNGDQAHLGVAIISMFLA